MAGSISSAEPEELFRYSDFGMRINHELVSESCRLASRLQHFEATCTEPGYRVSVGHMSGAVQGYGRRNESVDSWVRRVGEGFQTADQGWGRAWYVPGFPSWNSPSWSGLISTLPVLLPYPIMHLPGWLSGILTRLPWLRQRSEQIPSAPWDQQQPERVAPEPGPTPRPAPTPPDSGQDRSAPEPVRSRFGELLDRSTEPEPEPDTAQDSDQWWIDVPLQSQKGLTYGEQETEYGCTPTATSMILDYWHSQDSANETMSAQQLLDTNAGQGVFGDKGMSATNVLDEVSGLGYGSEVHTNSNLEALKEAVAKGPVIAVVKLNMKTTGENHAIVVTGISEDGQQVRINDPWTGEAHTYSWSEFSKSWGADFGKDKQGNAFSKNNFVEIWPSQDVG